MQNFLPLAFNSDEGATRCAKRKCNFIWSCKSNFCTSYFSQQQSLKYSCFVFASIEYCNWLIEAMILNMQRHFRRLSILDDMDANKFFRHKASPFSGMKSKAGSSSRHKAAMA